MKFVKARYSGIEWWGLKFRRMGEVKSIFWWRDLGCLDISEVNKYGWLSKSARSLNLFLEESLSGTMWMYLQKQIFRAFPFIFMKTEFIANMGSWYVRTFIGG